MTPPVRHLAVLVPGDVLLLCGAPFDAETIATKFPAATTCARCRAAYERRGAELEPVPGELGWLRRAAKEARRAS